MATNSKQTHVHIEDNNSPSVVTTCTSQASEGEDDTLQPLSKMLLTDKSLKMTRQGQTILRSTSESSGVDAQREVNT